MTYDFFADKQDKIDILNFIFNETDLHIYDSYSLYEQEICEYKTLGEITEKFDLEAGDKFAITFQLWSARHKGKPDFRKFALDPKRCKGFTFRYSTNGLGLIQLYFGGINNNGLNQSHIGHFNEKGAMAAINPYDKASNWDWVEIQKTSRKIKYQIHNKMAVRKTGSFGILSGADIFNKQGVKLC